MSLRPDQMAWRFFDLYDTGMFTDVVFKLSGCHLPTARKVFFYPYIKSDMLPGKENNNGC